jgi:hypothetical protein
LLPAALLHKRRGGGLGPVALSVAGIQLKAPEGPRPRPGFYGYTATGY